MPSGRARVPRRWSWADTLAQVAALLVCVGCALAGLASRADAQAMSAVTYPFAASGSVALEDLSSGATQILGPNLDAAASTVQPIGFEFWFMGVRHTQFSANSDGLLRLGAFAVTASGSNNLASTSNVPQVAPYWDNLWIGANGDVRYKVLGAAPARKLVVEWRNIQVPRVGSGANGAATFQCWLFEGSGRIQFVYGSGMAPNSAQGGASVGFGSSATAFASVTVSGPSVAYGTANNANVAAIASGTSYSFSPPVPAAPTGLAFSAVSAVSMTLSWTDNATSEVGYAVYRSTDGATYSFVTQVPANTTSLVQSGLAPSTTYHWDVRAVGEGAVSAGATGTQATSPPGAVATAGSGNWSSTVPGAPWPGGTPPTSSDVVTVADGHTLTLDVAASVLGLVVGQGGSGTLQFEEVTARTLTVGGDVAIAPGGALTAAPAGTQTGHVLSVGGSLVNDGVLDLSTNGDLAGAGLTFTGASAAGFGGSGPTTDLRTLALNKGSGPAAELWLAPAALTVRGTAAAAPAFLTLTNGTLRLGGTFAFSSVVFASASYGIGVNAGLWLDNPNFEVLPQNGSPFVAGALRVSAGTLRVGTQSGNSLEFADASRVTIEGGEIHVAGRFAVSSSTARVTYTQSGGTVTAAEIGHASSSLASVDFGVASGSVIAISGGSLVLQTPGSAASGARDFRNLAGTSTMTGGSLVIGNAFTTLADTFFVQGTAPGLVIGNAPAGNTVRLSANASVRGTTTITAGATLLLAGFRFTQAGGDLENQGTITSGGAGSELYFLGTGTPQTYRGAGVVTAPLGGQGLSIDNPAGVTIDPSIPANLVTRQVNLVRGTLVNSQLVTLGYADSVVAMTTLGAAGVTTPGGAYDTYPVFNPGTGGLAVSYLEEAAGRTTGLEIPPDRSLKSVTINNPNGVAVAGGEIAIRGSLTLTAGVLRTTAANVLRIDTTGAAPAGSAASYVEGPLAISVMTGSSVTRTFAVGDAAGFRPLVLKSLSTGGAFQTFVAEVVPGATGGTPVAPLVALTSTRYWRVTNASALNATARVNLAFGVDDGVGTLANARVAQSATANGSYANLGGVTTGTQTSGTVESTVNLVPGSGYFAIGSTSALAAEWDGGAGTTNWGDAANWNPDGVPGSTSDVSLATATPVTISVSGARTIRNLIVAPNVTLDVGAGTLNVTGTYTQTGGTLSSGPGALNVTGVMLLSGGTFSIVAGTVTTTAAFTVSGGTLSLSGTGRLLALSSLTQSGGSIALGSGTLELRGDLTRTAGTSSSGTSTTILSGANTQNIGGGIGFYDLVLRNGGAGKPKRLTAENGFVVNNDLTVESTAQLALSAANETHLTLWGNLLYAGLSGGSSISNLRIDLRGTGKRVDGSPELALLAGEAAVPEAEPPAPASVVQVDLRTDPATAEVIGTGASGKPLLRLDNTYEKRRATVDSLIATVDPAAQLVIDLDDQSIIRGPTRPDLTGASLESGVGPTTFDMLLIVESTAAYQLGASIAMASGRTLSVSGRLECGLYTVGGAGSLALASGGELSTTTASALGLGATVTTTGTDTYGDGSIIEYAAAGNQTINTANHPSASLIRAAGGGTKSLDGSKVISGAAGLAQEDAALYVATGTTFSDAGHTLSFTTSQFAHVVVLGTYASSGSGGLSFQSGTFDSDIRAVDGTVFGDLFVNFNSSTLPLDLAADGVANLTFRNVTFGGIGGSGVAGGTLQLSKSGTTNVTVTGNVAIVPRDSSTTGGGFGGTAGKTSAVRVRGNLTTTSRNDVLSFINGNGANALILDGASPQTITLPDTASLLSGGTMRIANAAGATLAGAGRVYGIGAGATLDLAGGNLNTGSSTLTLEPGATLTRSGARVVGRLRRHVATSGSTTTFELGSPTTDTPVAVTVGALASPGYLAAASLAGDHPQVATSGIDPGKSMNRHYVLEPEGAVFDTATVEFALVPAEYDPGTDAEAFLLRRHDGAAWSPVAIGGQTPSSLAASGLTDLGGFAIGEQQFFTLSAGANAGGTVSPVGDLVLPYGATQVYAITPDSCHVIADVVVDGVSVGAVSSYEFATLSANHTIVVTFAIKTFSVSVSGGPNGYVSPAGLVTADCGTDVTVTIVPDSGYSVASVLVDGNPVGAVTSYAFGSLQADHTLAATFVPSSLVAIQEPAVPIGPLNPSLLLPVTISRVVTPAIRGFSVVFSLPVEFALAGGTGSISEGTFLNASGTTYYQVLELGDRRYQVDAAILGSACGPTAASGTLFTIGLTGAVPAARAALRIESVRLRDCLNQPLTVIVTDSTLVTVDYENPVVSLVEPAGGATWHVGSPQLIQWSASDAIGVTGVDISYSTDGGTTYPFAVATGLANTGSFAWTVPATVSSSARVRVVARDAADNAASAASASDFAIDFYRIVVSHGPRGTIAPSGTALLSWGADTSFAITPEVGFHVADVLVDGVSVGAVTTYDFNDVTLDHTIAATFLNNTTVTRNVDTGPQVVNFDLHNGLAHVPVTLQFANVTVPGSVTIAIVDGDHPDLPASGLDSTRSVNRFWSVTNSGVSFDQAGATIQFDPAELDPSATVDSLLVRRRSEGAWYPANVVARNDSTVVMTGITSFSDFAIAELQTLTITASAGANGSISPSGDVPVEFGNDQAFTITPATGYHVADVLVDGVSVGAVSSYTFTNVTANHTIAASFAIDQFTITATAGANGSISPSGAVTVDYGTDQAFTITPAVGYHVSDVLVDGVSVGAVTSYTFTGVVANHTIAASFAVNPAVPAIANLKCEQVRQGNDADGTILLALSWSGVVAGSAVEIYRAPFGGYPEYDDAAGSAPQAPSYPPAAPWAITAITASGQSEDAGPRDAYHYVAFVRDEHGTLSTASNVTSGTVNYHLGDVAGGATPGDGDNQVNTADLSLLGAHYGLSGAAAVAPHAYLDVGPTADRSVGGRPLTDDMIDFEDLVMFALNYGVASRPQAMLSDWPNDGPPTVTVRAPGEVRRGDLVTVTLTLGGTPVAQGLSVVLRWDPGVIEAMAVEGAPQLAASGGIVLSPAPGAVDAAMLGRDGALLQGDVATVTFRAIADGAPAIGVRDLRARDAENRPVALEIVTPSTAAPLPPAADLAGAAPNPFESGTTVSFALSRPGPVELSVFAVDGRLIRMLVAGDWSAGYHRVAWDGLDRGGTRVPSGVYYLRLVADGRTLTKSMVRIR